MAVDTDLFINAMIKGQQFGAATPSLISRVVSGFDEEEKARALRQQNEIRQNQIDMLPVSNQADIQQNIIRQNQIDMLPTTNRIAEAQADQADARLSAIRNDPETFEKLAKQKQDNELAAALREQQLDVQQQKLMDVLQNGTDQDKFDALTSGAYADLYTSRPDTYRGARSTIPGWTDKALRDHYWATGANNRVQTNIKTSEQIAAQNIEKTGIQYETDSNIGSWAQQLNATRSELLEYGHIEQRESLKETPVLETYVEDGQTLRRPKMVNGKPLMTVKEDAPLESKPVLVFQKPGEERKELPISGGEGVAKSRSLYTDHRGNYRTLNRLDAVQPGGDGSLKQQSENVDKVRSEQAALQNQQAANDAAQASKFREGFIAGTKVQYPEGSQMAAALEARNRARAAREARTPIPTPTQTPAPTDIPQAAPTVVTPIATRTPDTSRANANAATGDQTQSAASVSPSQPAPNSNPQLAEAERKKLQRKAEVQQRLQQVNPALQQQVQQTTGTNQTGFIPSSYTINTPHNVYNDEVAQRVNTIPQLKNSSALVKAVVAVESAGIPNAVSPTGATGLMQLTNIAVRDVTPEGINRFDPTQNVEVGTAYLQAQLRSKRDPLIALLAYNAGPGTAATAVRLAMEKYGTSDWEAIKLTLPDAIKTHYKPKDRASKLQEALAYPERVISFLPAFITDEDDRKLADLMEQRGFITSMKSQPTNPMRA